MDYGLAIFIKPAPYWSLLARKDFRKLYSCFCKTVRSDFWTSSSLEDGESGYLAYLGLHVNKAGGDLRSCDKVVHRTLDDVVDTALDVGDDRRVWPSGECWI